MTRRRHLPEPPEPTIGGLGKHPVRVRCAGCGRWLLELDDAGSRYVARVRDGVHADRRHVDEDGHEVVRCRCPWCGARLRWSSLEWSPPRV